MSTTQEDVEVCLADFHSADARVRLNSLERMLSYDDPRVLKALEALSDDPNFLVARRAQEARALRTGEILADEFITSDLGRLGLFGVLRAGARLLGSAPGSFFGVSVLVHVAAGVISAAFLALDVAVGGPGLVGSESMWADLYGAVSLLVGFLIFVQIPNTVAGFLAWGAARIYMGRVVAVHALWAVFQTRLRSLSCIVAQRAMWIALPWLGANTLISLGFLARDRYAVDFGESAPYVFVGIYWIGALLAIRQMLRLFLADMIGMAEGVDGTAALCRARALWQTAPGMICVLAIGTWILPMAITASRGSGGIFPLVAFILVLTGQAWLGLSQVVLFYVVASRWRSQQVRGA